MLIFFVTANISRSIKIIYVKEFRRFYLKSKIVTFYFVHGKLAIRSFSKRIYKHTPDPHNDSKCA